MYIFLWKTSVGYQLRAVGANASAAKTAGIPVNFYLIMAMTLSGGIAALAGVTEIFGSISVCAVEHGTLNGPFTSHDVNKVQI